MEQDAERYEERRDQAEWQLEHWCAGHLAGQQADVPGALSTPIVTAGLVTAVPYSKHPVRMDYQLTPAGRALRPVVDALASWGLTHLPGTHALLEPTAD